MKTKAVPAVVAGVIVVASVTGCGGGAPVPELGADSSAAKSSGDAPEADAGAEAPQAFVFESGVLEIGDFDPFTLGDDLFDPCTEITPEEFAAAGFGEIEYVDEELRGLERGLSTCYFSRHPELMVEAIGNNNASRTEIEAQGTVLSEFRSDRIPTLFVHGPTTGTDSACFAQVDTVRGGLVATAGGLQAKPDQDHYCRAAIENLELLFQGSMRL